MLSIANGGLVPPPELFVHIKTNRTVVPAKLPGIKPVALPEVIVVGALYTTGVIPGMLATNGNPVNEVKASLPTGV